ncbi:glycosyl transferase family 4 [Halanaerobacter jeridensis]|uniref:UDP-N-acetylmuramyl pentapeptide phosphotransferase/UDP-N-acetylglucosamine-1-phosphate transferase n=1 Tax=Halanaerobacter jeridensis TaxID=706427 RepID=A0A938XNC3_9FIRM|nr:glycosyl transferase family 4 [Halanaerobacter jeridensis]MBM7555252.1 UDP-N-acetylmuramyl pentapeptide phosphotransferase/UDP-N-acetylglucosamine-1-phosphate transferase [Halanaerobacter jeridensis]
MAILLVVLSTIFLTKISFVLVFDFLKSGGLVIENYQKQLIPYGYGLVFGINSIIILVLGTLVGVYELQLSTRIIILLLTMTLIGIIDDTLGQKEFQGFKGHLKALFLEFTLTTGFLKMSLSFIVTFYLFFYWYFDLLSALVATLIVLLAANFINLLDVRPGRALKGFILLSGIGLFFSSNIILLMPILIMVLFFLPVDLKAEAMMGDVGANVLGAVGGVNFIINISSGGKILMLCGLIIINFCSEICSLSQLISGNKLLNFLDQLGRN